MTYIIDIMPSCQKQIGKVCRKNPIALQALRRKMDEIIENPSRYKPLMYDLTGERRVHILKSFILKFEVDETRKVVTFIAFKHHDDAYRR